MDTYAVDGLKSEQIHYLYAPTHLNPTYEYGVSFERGTYVDYGDRRQVFISGTASINNKGEVVYPGDIRKQTERMWENVEALLKEAGCTFDDLGQMIVYLRDVVAVSPDVVVAWLLPRDFGGSHDYVSLWPERICASYCRQ